MTFSLCALLRESISARFWRSFLSSREWRDMRGKLTKRSVDALKSDVRDQFIWDTEIPGFGCKVTPKGARIYILQYGRLGRDHRVTIGRHGSDVTAEQARLEALRLRGIVAAGENPATARTRERSASTIC